MSKNSYLVGLRGNSRFPTGRAHSAESYGNGGVDVLATPALVGMIEVACHKLLSPDLSGEEATVGVRLELSHVAAAPIGVSVDVEAEIVEIHGNEIVFEAQASANGHVLMSGRHSRSLVNLERLKSGIKRRFPAH